MEKIAILHTNDMHSHFENWPRVRHYILSKRSKLTRAGYQVLVVDDGDAIDRWHPLTDATNGQANIKQLNRIHYDAVTIGNNEGINNSHQILNHLYDHANFPVILDNLIDPHTHQIPKWAHLTKTFRSKDGTRIMFMGMTRAYENGYYPLGWQVKHINQVIPQMLKRFKGQYDVLVLLSHLGVNRDRYIAAHYPQFDIIIGGHSHHLFLHGERDNHSLLVAAKKFGYYVGCIQIKINHFHIIKDQASVVKTSDLPNPEDYRAEARQYMKKGNQLLAHQKIAKIPHTLKASLYGKSNLINEGLKSIMERTHTPAAMLSSGMFLRDLPRGIINMKQIHEALPHSVFPMRSILDGNSLWMLVKEVQKNSYFLSRYHADGMGFRGKIFGRIHFANIQYNPKTQVVYYNGEPVIPNKSYAIGMLEYYSFIPFFPVISIMGRNHIFHDKFFRVTFAEYLHRHYPIH